ncbi:hypothetical protein TNCT_190651 [Trichonephila clavata]|uniref:Uncharacterized protein n=1 Tax=Trichonephila clavata TaxID=2740835 RepID=A0A8X6GWL9_TRICU|nr:hypothetical protein TNCT_190651 [Trichonephila clavata]
MAEWYDGAIQCIYRLQVPFLNYVVYGSVIKNKKKENIFPKGLRKGVIMISSGTKAGRLDHHRFCPKGRIRQVQKVRQRNRDCHPPIPIPFLIWLPTNRDPFGSKASLFQTNCFSDFQQ